MTDSTRLKLHNKLCEILGTSNVYYRAPSSGMKYPCIKYEFSGNRTFHADNAKYLGKKRWTLTVIDQDPDSEIPKSIEENLAYSTFDRTYESDGLNHFVLNVYY